MKLGVSGYLTKKCAGENIVEAIHAVSEEEYFVIVREKKYLIPHRQLKLINTTLNSILTDRELKIIILIALEIQW
jgi:DNA-binding NarL/FixJ family response regulator